MSNIVSPQNSSFSLADGFRPAKNGTLYIGAAGTDPTVAANRLTVTGRKSDGTVVALTQPITLSTTGNPIDANGNSVDLLVDTHYSFATFDYYGKLQQSVSSQLVLEVDGFATLRTLPVVYEGQRVTLLGWNKGSNLGGGTFIGHKGTKTDDGGVVASGAGFYWERELEEGTVLSDYYGVTGGNTVDIDERIRSIFNGPAKKVIFTAGTYTINSKIKVLISKDFIVECQEGTIFKLANNVRKNMFVIVGDRTNNFHWNGGELDGNWAGQGEETLNASGTFSDLSHGLIISLFNKVLLENVFVHDFRGHNINHGGNKFFHARDIKVWSHIATAFPQGGSRGDGITGCSEDVLIENVYGFTTDDMVAVFSGCLWIEGGTPSDSNMITNLDYLTIRSITIRNVNPWHKLSDLDGTTTVYTWNAVSISGQGGVGIEKIHVSNIKGFTQYSGVRIGNNHVTGNSSATDYWLPIGSVIISEIDIAVAGTTNNQHLYNSIRIGILTADTGKTNTYTSSIDSLTISNIKLYPSGSTRSLIVIGYTTIPTITISGITVNSKIVDDTYNIINCVGDRLISSMSISDVVHNSPTATTSSIMEAQLVLNWGNTNSTASKLYFNNLPIRRNSADTIYISNVLTTDSATQPEIYGYSAVVRNSRNFSAIQKVKGVHLRDRYLGKVSVGVEGKWILEEFSTVYDSTTLGKPNNSLLPGYQYITWEEGMFVKTTGSAYGEISGWRFNKDNNWQMVGGYLTNNMVSMIDTTTTPLSFAPYTTIKSPIYNDSLWPESLGAVEMFTGHPNNRAGAYEIFNAASTKIYRRTWNTNTSAWNSWFSVTLA